VVSLIFVTKITDIGALILGSIFGKHKLAPRISPGKTIEGAVGGISVSMITVCLIYWLGGIRLDPHSAVSGAWDLPRLLTAAALVAAAGIAGDLMESSWKRLHQTKNSGDCLPGLGGAYDLTDSLIMSAPVGYLLMRYFVFA
jgi:phosphatidate cytidylyltransferase